MDYEAMGVRELQAEAKRRGLGTARSKADLIQRLTGNDAQQSGTFEDDFAASPAAVTAPAGDEAPTPEPTPIRAFRKTFQAEPGGPDEETHLAYREATRQAALEAGLTPRGDARLAEAGGDTWVYEILVRQVI